MNFRHHRLKWNAVIQGIALYRAWNWVGEKHALLNVIFQHPVALVA
jgi:hypothetical protein